MREEKGKGARVAFFELTGCSVFYFFYFFTCLGCKGKFLDKGGKEVGSCCVTCVWTEIRSISGIIVIYSFLFISFSVSLVAGYYLYYYHLITYFGCWLLGRGAGSFCKKAGTVQILRCIDTYTWAARLSYLAAAFFFYRHLAPSHRPLQGH